MTFNLRAIAAAWLAVLVLAACGGGATTTSTSSDSPSEAETAAPSEAPATEAAAGPSKDEWIDAALVECEAVNAALDETEPQGDPFSPDATDKDREQGITYLTAASDSLGAFSQNLRDLGFPPEEPEGAEAIVDAADASSEKFGEAAETAAEDFAAAEPIVGEAFGSFGALEAAASEYGIADLENCKREGKPKEEVAQGANEIAVTPIGEDGKYDFEFAQPVPAGQTAFVLDNTDDEPHFMFLAKLTGELSLDELLKAEQDGENPEDYAKEVGGSDDAAPGEQVVLNVENLKPGTYGMLCYIPGPDGTPHAYSGMAVEFEVE